MRSSQKRTFKPTPPAFKLTTSTLPFLEKDLNSLIAALFFLTSIVPSNRYWSNLSLSKATWMRSKKLVNCENTTARKHGSWSRSLPENVYDELRNGGKEVKFAQRLLIKASSFVEDWKSFLRNVSIGSEVREFGMASKSFFSRMISTRSLLCTAVRKLKRRRFETNQP